MDVNTRAPVALLVLSLLITQVVEYSFSRPLQVASSLPWEDQAGLQVITWSSSDEQTSPASSTDTSHPLSHNHHQQEAIISRLSTRHGATFVEIYKTTSDQDASASGTQQHGDVQTSAQVTQLRADRVDDSGTLPQMTYRHLMASFVTPVPFGKYCVGR